MISESLHFFTYQPKKDKYMIEVQYNDVNYTSKKNREIIFNSINDNILRDFLDNDMDLPCESCELSIECENTGKECMAFRNWSSNGRYELDTIQKHMRMPRKE